MPATPSRPLLPILRPRRALRHAGLAAAVLLAGTTSGCGPSDDKFPPICPSLSLLGDGSDLTRFTPGGHDVTDMVMHARIVGVPAKCVNVTPTQLRATLSVQTDVVRGPAAKGQTVSADYFVAVTEGQRVLNEQDFTLSATFPPNVDHMDYKSDEIELLLPVSAKKSAAAYHIYIGFRLTPDELRYNRTHPTP